MSYVFKHLLKELTAERAVGPSATFSVLHLIQAIELIAKEQIGRNKLAEKLGVGEGAVRTLIGRLIAADLISTSKTGCKLTKKGLSLWKEYTSILRKIQIEENELTHADHNSAILVRNRGHKIKSGMEQRDAAIIVGARNATTILLKNGKLKIPSVSDDVAEDFPEAAKQIIKFLEPEENDVVIIAGGDSPIKAEYGALAAAWTLLDDD